MKTKLSMTLAALAAAGFISSADAKGAGEKVTKEGGGKSVKELSKEFIEKTRVDVPSTVEKTIQDMTRPTR